MANLKEILNVAAEDYKMPEGLKNKILGGIKSESEPEVVDSLLYDGDYPPFGSDISDFITET